MAEKKRKTELDIEGITPGKPPEPPPPPPPEEPPPPPVEEEKHDEKPKSKGNKKIFVIAGAVSVVILVGVIVVVKSHKPALKEEKVVQKEKEKEKEKEKPKEQAKPEKKHEAPKPPEKKPEQPAFEKVNNLAMEPFILTQKTKEGEKFLRVAFTLQINSEDGVAEAKENMALIRKGILFYLGTKDKNEILDEDGRQAILKDLKYNIDKSLQNGRVVAVLITEFNIY
jgi:flagellar basal body-associated protein FliL